MEELYNLYIPDSIVKITESRTFPTAGYVSLRWKQEIYTDLWGGRSHLID
jgi:hypothetical protein